MYNHLVTYAIVILIIHSIRVMYVLALKIA